MYRGFFYAHTRVLLSLQYQIETLEDELENLDQWDALHNGRKQLVSIGRDERRKDIERMPDDFQAQFKRTRPSVLEELEIKLTKHGEL